jgi:2-oxo-4-hydroxy-4-carboxy-5-ureidoimidazoline decarboxylase
MVAAGLPYDTREELLLASDQAFDRLDREDWMEAFAAHSMIGAPRQGDPAGGNEQAGIEGADAELRTALAAGNVEYCRRFGFVFLIRARGRSAAEMLAALRERIDNSAEIEFATACGQQREITALRLTELAGE